jgi:hypothetical protein
VVGVAMSPPPTALSDALTPFFLAGNPPGGPRPSGELQADSMAAILDAWTRTVLVTNTPAIGTPTTVPLS